MAGKGKKAQKGNVKSRPRSAGVRTGMSDDLQDQEITRRQGDILKILIEDYIQTGQPVSSLSLVQRHDPGLSSASIRFILSDLEELGYVYAPHRSSGKIPTENGYRYYISKLPGVIPPAQFAEEQQRYIQKEYLKREFQIREILDVTCGILSALTNYAGIVIGPSPEKAVLKHVELMDMGQDELLVVIVTRSGTVYTRSLFVDERIPRDNLIRLSRFLTENFKGMDLEEIQSSLDDKNIEGDRELSRSFSNVLGNLHAAFDSIRGKEDVFIAGLDRLINHIDGKDPDRIRSLGQLYDARDLFSGIFKRTVDLDDVMVTIEGDEEPRLAGLSILAGSYRMGGRAMGAMGVVGPNRMNYIEVIRIIEYLRIVISGMMTRMTN